MFCYRLLKLMSQALPILIAMLLLSVTIGCGDDEINPDKYTPVTDPGEQNKLLMEIWQILTAPSCWDASTSQSVTQYQFFNPFQYRYVGFETTVGRVIISSVGHLGGHKAAQIFTWDESVRLLVISNKKTLTITWWYNDGYPVTLEYVASDRCL